MFENSKTKIYYVFTSREFHYIFLERRSIQGGHLIGQKVYSQW